MHGNQVNKQSLSYVQTIEELCIKFHQTKSLFDSYHVANKTNRLKTLTLLRLVKNGKSLEDSYESL